MQFAPRQGQFSNFNSIHYALLRLSNSRLTQTLAQKVNTRSASSMADSVISVEKIKSFWHSQVHDEEKWALNMKLLRAAGLFAGSIFLMRNYGDLMGI